MLPQSKDGSTDNASIEAVERLFKADEKKEIGSSFDSNNEIWNKYKNEMEKQSDYHKESIEIQPIPCFVCKTVLKDETASIKAFINICSHQMIGRCSQQIEPKSQQIGWRIPVSCGEGQIFKDPNKDALVCAFDAVFHPNTVKQALNDFTFKQTICMLAAKKISEKLAKDSETDATKTLEAGCQKIDSKSTENNVDIENKNLNNKSTRRWIDTEKPFIFPKAVYKGANGNKVPPKQRIRKKGAGSMVEECNDENETIPNENSFDIDGIKNITNNLDAGSEVELSNVISEMLGTNFESKYDVILKPYVKISIRFDSNVNDNNSKSKKLKFNSFNELKKQFSNINVKEVTMVEFLIDFNEVANDFPMCQSDDDIDKTDLVNLEESTLNCNDEMLELVCDVSKYKCLFKIFWQFEFNQNFGKSIDLSQISAKYVKEKQYLKIKCPLKS